MPQTSSLVAGFTRFRGDGRTDGRFGDPPAPNREEDFVAGDTVSIAISGAGVMTAAQMLLDAAAKAGLYRMPEVPTCCRNRGRKSPLSNA